MSQIELILDSLNDIGYTSTFTENEDLFKQMIDQNLPDFSKLVSYITKELSKILNIEEFVNPIETQGDSSSFYLEICAFLKEISCPYRSLTSDAIDQRFQSSTNKLKLIEFLISELQASQLIAANRPQEIQASTNTISNESEETKALKSILITLGFPKPPANVTAKEVWSRVEAKCSEILSKLPKSYLGKPLVNALLNDDQWSKLIEINQALCEDFQMRRELLLTRLDVTIQSFKWADRLKKNNQEIAALYQQKRKDLSVRPNVKLYYILTARDDLLKQEKTCSSRLMTKSQLHKVIIPKVPDRGGRTCELQPPPPEMPAFMQRKASNQPQGQRQQQGGGRGGYDGRRNDNYSNKWNDQGGQNFRPKGDFERFQNTDYHGGTGNSGDAYGRGGRGGYRGGRGGRNY
ncbi:unnamed protein product [Brachionus calyciflorus]|uniref:FAM98A n=1 Tax=Brachionus calyciflorus TaxID=104777 RepID=A0A813ZJ80_9BILA|nr:unnamed protein product [Brachionus calyciflorus]